MKPVAPPKTRLAIGVALASMPSLSVHAASVAWRTNVQNVYRWTEGIERAGLVRDLPTLEASYRRLVRQREGREISMSEWATDLFDAILQAIFRVTTKDDGVQLPYVEPAEISRLDLMTEHRARRKIELTARRFVPYLDKANAAHSFRALAARRAVFQDDAA